ncbi:branched-chain amino acid ABC transporter permease [Ferrovibrio terrae]|uniref:Branched-chain amino acid ABC transporter permease n=1 Tax=Ferrovibrio terrae TaxID=2594003 RepID=A0A516GYV1_9PROT|nr:branched-chain amino acid ABC transporter permease [Ferrovibrio terrae]QDO96711.1 branched-chain amino acid ABC transporter permease [Ferrovibrio terrae]
MTDTTLTAPRGNPALDLLRRYGIWVIALIVMLVLPKIFTSGAALTTMCLMGIMIVFSLAYNMLLGQTGMLSFGHAVYYGLGGFLAVHAMNVISAGKLPIPLPVVPLVGGLMGLIFGFIFGAVSTRRAGTVFAMISLGLGELIASLSLILRGFFGGEEGINANRTKMLSLWGVRFGPQIEVYYLIASWCFVCMIAMYAFTRTPLGRMCNAVRDNPERAEFVGYSTQMVRFITFCISGFFAGIAGGLAAINFELMNAVNISGAQSGSVLLMAYIGGIGHFMGPVLGAVLVVLLQVFLSDLTGAWMLYFGLIFIMMVMFAPGGIAGLIMLHLPLWQRGTLLQIVPAYAVMLVPALMGVAGAVALIETAHHQLVKTGTEGPAMKLFGIAYNSNTVLPWIVALALIGGGVVLGKLWGPHMADAYSNAAHGKEASK